MSTLRKAALICAVLLVFGAYSGLGSNIGSVSLEPPDSALVSQSGPSPIRLDQTADLDNVVYLMAAGSAHSPDLTVLFPDAFPKHFWVNNFNNTPQVLQWTVYSPIQADYHVEALISTNIGETFDASVFPPAEFTQRGTGDRSALFDDWEMIITEIGQRYGDKLDGWFFEEDQSIMTKVTPADAAKWRAAAAARNVPISFTLMMWEDGTVFQDSLDLF